MDYPRVALEQLVDCLRDLLRRHGLREAYVFGSRVRGDYLHRSDLDVIVVDERYESVPFLRRGMDLMREWPFVTPELELLCYTPAEFARGNSLIRAARQYGIRVAFDDEPVLASSHSSA